MLETMRAGVSHLAAHVEDRVSHLAERLERNLPELPSAKKNRKSTGGASSRGGGALAEALRARGGTTNLDTVISHASAASDTEAFASKRRSTGGQGKKRLVARAATTDDDLGERPSSQANLGWLDLQAFAPRALQRQLERLADSVDGPVLNARSDDDLPSAPQGIAGLLAGLPDRFGSSGGATSSATPRGIGSSGRSRADLLASFKRRGGVGTRGEEEEAAQLHESLEEQTPDALHESAVEDEEEPEASLHPLPSVPEEIGVSGELVDEEPDTVPSPLPQVAEEEEEEVLIPSLDAHQQPEAIREEIIDASSNASANDSALTPPPVGSREEEDTRLVSDDFAQESIANSCVHEAEAAQEIVEVCRDAPVEVASTKLEIAPPVKDHAKADPVVLHDRDDAKTGVAARIKAVESSSVVSRPLVDAQSEKPKPKATESKRPPVAQWHPVVETPTKLPAAKNEIVSEIKEKAAEKEARDNKKFSDVHNFWKKNSMRFAGPAIGNKGISQVEAQAALQRLLSNSSAVDFNEVRRLRKLTENKENK